MALDAQRKGDKVMEGRAFRKMYAPIRKGRHTRKPEPDAFWERIAFGVTECWHWVGNTNKDGYGITPSGKMAHRYAFQLFGGTIPSGMVVMHRCDNPGCVNPDHLAIGTQADNVRDMEQKGRGNHACCIGERNPKAKLTREQALEIKTSKDARRKLMARYGVSYNTIARIQSGQSWNK